MLAGYGQFCPIAQAAEALTGRWMLLVIRELLAGSTRFNDIGRGVPLMSSSLLDKRRGELERAGIITQRDVVISSGLVGAGPAELHKRKDGWWT
jgi:DNA-binding HxlR family transcriptional regulator